MIYLIIYILICLILSFIMVCEDFFNIKRTKRYTVFEFIKSIITVAIALPIILAGLFFINLSFLSFIVDYKTKEKK
jgi:hypothetical protein